MDDEWWTMCSGMMSAGRRVLDDERCVVPDRAVILTRRAFRRAVMDGSFRYRAKEIITSVTT